MLSYAIDTCKEGVNIALRSTTNPLFIHINHLSSYVLKFPQKITCFIWYDIKGKLNIFNWVYWRSIGLSLTSVGLLGSMSPLNILPSTSRPWCTSRKRVFHQSVHCMVASMDWLHVGFYKRSSSIGWLYWIISTGLLVTNMFNYISGTTQSGWSICALSLSMSVLLVSVLQCVPNSATLLTASVSAPFSTEDCPALYLTE